MKSTATILFCLLTLAAVPSPGADKSNRAKTNKPAESATQDDKEWKRRTEGHRPQDLNGDGVITRNEWPGDDASFKELDSDGDGTLTNKDKGPGAQGSRTRMYDRTVNDYPNRKKK